MSSALFLLTNNKNSRLIVPFSKNEKHSCAKVKRVQKLTEPTNICSTSDDVIFEDYQSSDGYPIVKSATFQKLIELLTTSSSNSSEFMKTFLMTFRLFCEPVELFDLLIEQFSVPSALNCSGSIYYQFLFDYRRPIQRRILQAINCWVCHHFYDFNNNPLLLDKLIDFLNGRIVKFTVLQQIWCSKIKGTIKRKQKNEDVNVITGIRRLSPKKHYFSKLSNYHRLTYFDFWTTNPRNIARQLALLNFYLLKQIRPNELVGTGWMRKDKYERSPHLMALIDSNTRVTYWIARKIVEERSIVNRARMISSILGIMKECEVLQNFSAVVMLYSSLSCSSVFRLHSTKALLSDDDRLLLEHYDKLCDPHWKTLAIRLRGCSLPCIPFVGVYLSQLVYLENGLKDDKKMISFRKCRKISAVIREILRFQRHAYSFSVDKNAIEFFLSMNPMEGFADEKELETYLYTQSQIIEPSKCVFKGKT